MVFVLSRRLEEHADVAHVERRLDLDLELRQRAQDLIVPVSRPDTTLTDLAGSGFIERGESFAEVVTPELTLTLFIRDYYSFPAASPPKQHERQMLKPLTLV